MGCSTSVPAAVEERTLTSRAVAKTADNNYSWQDSELLVPHEPIRRELLYVARALDLLDLFVNPWHIKVLYKYLSEFFVPSVHFHHDNEEEILGPYYEKLGEKADYGKSVDHKTLLDTMDSYLIEVKSVLDLVATEKASETDLRTKESELKSRWAALSELMLVHLAEEEDYWPAVYLRSGQKHAKAVLQLILKKDFALKGAEAIAANAFAGAVMDAIGPLRSRYAAYKYTTPAHGLSLGPWASPEMGADFMQGVPFLPRTLILPMFHKTYITKWRRQIESIGGQDNPLIE